MWLLLAVCAAALHCGSSVQWPPRITKMPPTRLDFVMGESVKIECEAEGNPPPQFSWTRNDEEFDWTKNAGRYKKYPGAGTIVIINPQRDDDGIYQCFAANQLGRAASVKVVVRRSELLAFPDSRVQQRDTQIGRSIKLDCISPHSYPTATILWYRKDIRTNSMSTVPMSNRIAIDPIKGSLLIGNVIDSDRYMEYMCSARNEVMRRTTDGPRYRLSVRSTNTFPPAQLMVQSSAVVNAFANSSQDIFCFFSGNPTPQIQWKKDDLIITASQEWSKFQLLDSGTRLRLTDINEETHAGSYQCAGTNEGSGGLPASGTFNVRVQYRPYWIKKPQDVSVPEGGSHTFECDAAEMQGDPKWYVNGIPATSLTNISAPVGKRFSFFNLTMRDSVVVQCNCSNSRGYVYTNAYINVLREPPAFTRPPADVKAAARSTLVIPCQTLSAPAAVIVWTKNGEPITGGRYELQDNGDLLIAELSITDSGLYTCTAKNMYGERNASATLTVRQPTEITVPPKDTRIYEGREVKLICTAYTDQKEETNLVINWSKDGTRVDFSANPRLVINPQDYSLIISGTRPLDTGIYTCNATNGLDYDYRSAQLVIMGKPEMPTNVNADCEKLKARSQAEVSWNPGPDNNAPILKYIVEFSTQYAADTWYRAELVGGANDLTNTQVQVRMKPHIRYRFRVKGVNVVGESEPSRATTDPDKCFLQPAIPSVNPTNLWAEGNRPQNLIVYWTPLSPLDYNGEDVTYTVMVQCMNCTTMPNDQVNETQVVNPRQEKMEFTALHFGSNVQHPVEIFKYYRVSIYAKNSVGESSGTRPESFGYSGGSAPEVTPLSLQLDPSAREPLTPDSALLHWQLAQNPVTNPQIMGYFRGFRMEYCLTGLTPAECNAHRRYQDFIFREIQGPSMVGLFTPNTADQSQSANGSSVQYSGRLTHLPGDSGITVRARVLNKFYAGPAGDSFEFRTKVGTPGQVQKFQLTLTGVNHLEFDWEPPTQTNGPLRGYQMAYQEVSDLTLGYLTMAPVLEDPSLRRGAVTGLRPSTLYRVYIYARTDAGNGEPSFQDVRTAPPNVAPNAPTFAVAVAGERSFNVSFLPSAAGVAGSVFYAQYRIPGRSQWFESQREYRQRWILLEDLLPDTWYEIRLAATNGAAMTTYSERVAFRTGGTPGPAALSGASATWFIIVMLILLAIFAAAVAMYFVRQKRLEKERGQLVPNEEQPGGYDDGFGHLPPDTKPHTFTGAEAEEAEQLEAAAAAAAAAAEGQQDEYAAVAKPPPPPPKPRKPRSIDGSLDNVSRPGSDDAFAPVSGAPAAGSFNAGVGSSTDV